MRDGAPHGGRVVLLRVETKNGRRRKAKKLAVAERQRQLQRLFGIKSSIPAA